MLCVFAHPDDECYGPGGAIARYALSGVDVRVLMFTRGEAGSIGVSGEIPGRELSRLRTRELACSCRALGVRSHRILGVPDKGVGRADPERAVAEIARDIDDHRPHVVLTFHGRGVSGHPDHIAVAGLLDRAFAAGGEGGPLKCYQWGIPRELTRLYDRPNLVPMEADEVACVIDVAPAAMDRKVAAIECHETQIEFFRSLERSFDYRVVASKEYFALRDSRIPRSDALENDLFRGVPGWGGG
jgi:LmbE family N-acetylglucosaminyl deacetylase